MSVLFSELFSEFTENITCTISSNNTNKSTAKSGDRVSLKIEENNTLFKIIKLLIHKKIISPTIFFLSGHQIAAKGKQITFNTIENNDELSAFYKVSDNDSSGIVSFYIKINDNLTQDELETSINNVGTDLTDNDLFKNNDYIKNIRIIIQEFFNNVKIITPESTVIVETSKPTPTNISIATSNSNTTHTKLDDVITLTFDITHLLLIDTLPTVTLTFKESDNSLTSSSSSNNLTKIGNINRYTYTYTFNVTDGNNGFIEYDIGTVEDEAGNSSEIITNMSSIYSDNTPPTLSGISITSDNNDTTIAKSGDTVTLTFTANEEIQQDPTVVFKSGGSDINNTVITYSNIDSNNTWTASYIVNDNDQDGNVSFNITVTDLAGNTSNEYTSISDNTSVTVDNNSPTLSGIYITSNNSDTTIAKSGDTVTLTFTANEEIQQDPTVVFKSGGSDIKNTVITYSNIDSNNTWSASYIVNDSDQDGIVSFNITVTDLVGNTSTGYNSVNDNTSVTVDNTPPTLSGISITSNNSDTTRAKSDDTVTLTFTTDEEIQQDPTVVFKSGGSDINNTVITYYNIDSINTWTASYIVNDNDQDGNVSFNITITDLVGNSNLYRFTFDNTSVTVDNTPPTISGISITSDNRDNTIAKSDDTVTLTFTTDEEIQQDPTVVFKSGDSVINNSVITYSNIDSNNTWTASYTVNDNDQDGIVSFNITVTDLVGNTSNEYTSISDNTSVTVDNTPPSDPTKYSIVSKRLGSTEDFNFASVGDIVSVNITFNELVTISSATFKSGGVNVTNDAYGNNWNNGSNTHTVTYIVSVNDTEGVVSSEITYADKAGNTTIYNTTNDNYVTIDKTPAKLTYKSIFSDNSDNSIAKSGDTIRLEFTSSESVAYSAYGADVPTVLFYALDSDNNVLTTITPKNVTTTNNNFAPNDTTDWAYEGVVPDNTTITEISYKVTKAYDRAGNISILEDTENDFVLVDNIDPTISSTSIISNNSNNTNYAKSGDIITLTINPSEPINQPTVYFNVGATATAFNSNTTSILYSQQISKYTWTATYTIGSNSQDGDGLLYYTIKYSDIAGNNGEDYIRTSDINVITSTPTLATVSLRSNNNTDNLAKSGDTATVYFTGSRDLNSATVEFLDQTESVNAIFDSEWEASYKVQNSDSDGAITFTITFEDLAGNTSSSSVITDGTSVIIDNTAPIINAIETSAFSWGNYLNIYESSNDGGVNVTTSGVEDGQTLTLTLNNQSYTGTVTENLCLVAITSNGLNALTDGYVYYIKADVSDLVGNAADSVTSSYFTVDTTAPTITNITSIPNSGTYKSDDTITILLYFSEKVYVTGYPTLTLTLSSDSNTTAIYDSGSESSILLFKYTVNSDENTIENNIINYLNVESVNVDTTNNYIEDIANNKLTDITITTPLTDNAFIVIDTTSPSDFTVQEVYANGGIYVPGYYNSSNTSVSITVPIENDVSLVDGTVRLIFSTNNKTSYDTTSFSKYDYTIRSVYDDQIYTFFITEKDFENTIDECAEIHFSAIITDKAGNSTTGTASSDSIIRDDIPPHPVTVGTITADGGRVTEDYYNSTNDGLTISVPINNNSILIRTSETTSNITGTIQVLISVNNGQSYNEIGELVSIEEDDLLTNKLITISDQDFIGAVLEGESAIFNVTITDNAGNITSSSPPPPDVTVSPAPDYTNFDPYANVPSSIITRQETLPPIPNVSFTTGSTKTNFNNKISVQFANTIVNWEYTLDGGISYTSIYNNNSGFILLNKGIYLPGSIIIRNYDIADNRSFVSNSNKIIITSSRQGFPLANISSFGAINKKKGTAISRATLS